MRAASPVPRPSSQGSKRHVIAITESMRTASAKMSIAAPSSSIDRQPIAMHSTNLADRLDETRLSVVPPEIGRAHV